MDMGICHFVGIGVPDRPKEQCIVTIVAPRRRRPPHASLNAFPTSLVKRKIAPILIGVILIAIVAAAAVLRTPPQYGTATASKQTTLVRIGQPFILEMDAERNAPVEITFTAARFTANHSYTQADSCYVQTGDVWYRLLILEIQVKNVGTKETSAFVTGTWEVTVEKGYTYISKHNPLILSLRPDGAKTDEAVFEILEATTPVEVRYTELLNNQPAFVLDLPEIPLSPMGTPAIPTISIGVRLLASSEIRN
jgi:hypothetical protein